MTKPTGPIALLSVSDKTGIADFAKRLVASGWSIVSTGGTAKHLRASGIAVREVAELTGFPEMLDGRVKTLHPAVHAGILARRDDPAHMREMKAAGFGQISVVAVNLYPFEKTANVSGTTWDEAIEQIDIGGVALLRSAAKNHSDVFVACNPDDYAAIAEAVEHPGLDAGPLRRGLAARAFRHTAHYDACIAGYVERGASSDANPISWTRALALDWPMKLALRYGENPHQSAALYENPDSRETSVVSAKILHGKELGYNNVMDADAALGAVVDFDALGQPAAVIVKHSNPCGIATGPDLLTALQRARETDPESAFGGIVALNREVDAATAAELASFFLEVVVAPSFSDAALGTLTQKKNLRLLATGPFRPPSNEPTYRSIAGGMLACSPDREPREGLPTRVVSKRQPTDDEMRALLFAWRCAKWVKSNAIVFADAHSTIGIGAGQMSRADSTRLAAAKSRRSPKGAVMASDAFFPFRDGIDAAASHGIRAIIQPGGSVRDAEVIAAADEHDIAMVFTGMRHFRH